MRISLDYREFGRRASVREILLDRYLEEEGLGGKRVPQKLMVKDRVRNLRVELWAVGETQDRGKD